ncbi:hypothetical protein [Tardisphaera saccharovorans]
MWYSERSLTESEEKATLLVRTETWSSFGTATSSTLSSLPYFLFLSFAIPFPLGLLTSVIPSFTPRKRLRSFIRSYTI